MINDQYVNKKKEHTHKQDHVHIDVILDYYTKR